MSDKSKEGGERPDREIQAVSRKDKRLRCYRSCHHVFSGKRQEEDIVY